MVNIELRDGSHHCQKHTPEFLVETLECAHRITQRPLLVRMDAENDAAENLGIVLEDGSWFIVKRNIRSESKDMWLNMVKDCCKDIRNPRDGKTVYVGSSWRDVVYKDSDGAEHTICLRMV